MATTDDDDVEGSEFFSIFLTTDSELLNSVANTGVEIVDDSIVEPDQQVRVNLTLDGAIVAHAVGTIQDNDVEPLTLAAPADQFYTVGRPIPDLTLPEAEGGQNAKGYELTGPGGSALPLGLSFDEEARLLHGTPR